jgi:uncharacterized protein with HEPN domain
MRPERLYLHDIVEAADDIASFTRGAGYDEFVADRMRRSAVLQKLMVIGEAAAHVSPQMRERYPHVPWRDMVAFRSVVVHEYFGLSWPVVWDTLRQDVPAVRQQVATILRAEFPDDTLTAMGPAQ